MITSFGPNEVAEGAAVITTCKRIIRNLREEREREKSTRCVRIVNLKVQSVVLDDINIDMLSIMS